MIESAGEELARTRQRIGINGSSFFMAGFLFLHFLTTFATYPKNGMET
jgi:hypothetical protein